MSSNIYPITAKDEAEAMNILMVCVAMRFPTSVFPVVEGEGFDIHAYVEPEKKALFEEKLGIVRGG